MTDPGRDLLTKIERSIPDDAVSTTSILNTCILLGGRAGSSKLRDWASREPPKGYGPEDEPNRLRHAVGVCLAAELHACAPPTEDKPA